MKVGTRCLAVALSLILCIQSMPVNLMANEIYEGQAATGEISVSESSAEDAETVVIQEAVAENDRITSGNYEYDALNNEYITITAYIGSDTDVVIPTLIDGYIVQSISDSAFYENKTVQSVVIPDSVESVGSYAFYRCTSLSSITIGKSVTSIGAYAFAYCSALASVSLPSKITTVSQYTFSYCSSLSEVSLPEGITTIGERAFTSCTSLASIHLPNSVSKLLERAFWNCTKLEEVNYPTSLTTCGDYVFSGCSALTSVTVPEGVTILAGRVLYGASAVTEVSLPSTLTEIGTYAFCGANKLTTITLPSGLKKIGSYAFNGCSSLPNLAFPEGLTEIGTYAFNGCDAMTAVEYPDSLTTLGNGVFMNCDNIASVNYPIGLTNCGNSVYSGCVSLTKITVPDGVVNLPNNVFYGASYLKEVELPDTVKTIGNYAFYQCGGLSTINWPAALETIGSNAFYECVSLKSAVLPGGVKQVYEHAFYGCSGLTRLEFPDSVTTIGASAVEKCISVKSFTYPAGLTSMGKNVFRGCTKLAAITVPEGVISIPANAFYNANYLKNVYLPDTLTSIGTDAFYGCSSLTRMIIPPEVTKLTNSMFQNCTSMEGIFIGENVTTIQTSTFNGCSTDTLVIYGKTGTQAETFAGSKGYTFSTEELAYCKAVISGNVVDENDDALEGVLVTIYDCKNLLIVMQEYTDENGAYEYTTAEEGVTYEVTFSHASYDFEPSSKKIIAQSENVLSDVVGTPIVTGDEESEEMFEYSAINGSYISITKYTGNATTLIIPETIGDYTVQKIGDNVFKGNTTLENVVIPSTVTTIGEHAFRNCTNLKTVRFVGPTKTINRYAFAGCTSLETVVFREGLITMGDAVFNGCTSLAAVHLPNSLTTMGSGVFKGCCALAEFTYPMSLTSASVGVFEGCNLLTAITVPEGVKTLASYIFNGATYLTEVQLPSTLTVIGSNAFKGATGIESITLPGGLTTIGNSAFENCTGLTGITLPNGVKNVNDRAFMGCSKITVMEFPASVNTVGANALSNCIALESVVYPVNVSASGAEIFSGCSSLTQITVPEGVTKITDNMFNGAKYLKEISLPVSLEKIGASAFRSCTGLTEITLPQNLTLLDTYAFYECSNLKEIIIPEKVTTLGSYCFRGCSSLERVVLPDELQKLYGSAFHSCTSLTEINYPSGVTVTEKNVFLGCSKLTKIVVGDGMTTLPASAFEGASYLQYVYLPDSMEKISAYAFSGCSSLKRMILPSETKEIASYAFQNCTALNAVWVGDNVTAIADTAFSGCSTSTLVIYGEEDSYAQEFAIAKGYEFSTEVLEYCDSVISGKVVDEESAGVEGIYVTIFDCKNGDFVLRDNTDENGAFIFSEAETGVSYKITFSNGSYQFTPQSITIVAEDTNELEPVVAIPLFSDVEEEAESNFAYSKLSDGNIKITKYNGTASVVVIPEEINGVCVQAVGENSFKGNTTIETVLIPEHVTTVGYAAFMNCSNLQMVCFAGQTSTIGYNAFRGCSALTDIRFSEGLTSIEYNAFDGCSSLTKVTLPDSVTNLGNYIFSSCSNLAEVNYPRSLNSCGIYMFNSCSKLTHVTIPEGVKKVAQNTFYGFTGLVGVSLPSTLTTIGNNAFYGAKNLESIEFPEGLKTIGSSAFYDCNSLETPLLPAALTTISDSAFYNCSKFSGIVLPDSLKTLGASAFENCSGITEISYPNNLTTVGSNVFKGCKKLTKVTIPDGYTTLPSYALQGANYVEEIILPKELEKVGTYAFADCTALKTIDLPNNITMLDEQAFKGCSSLAELVVSQATTQIGRRCFWNCSALEKLTLPDGLTTIGEYAFSHCVALQEINYPLSLTTVGDSVFSGCESLYYMTVPEGVQTIPSKVFNNAKYFKEIDLPSTLLRIDSNAFLECDNLVKITIPENVETIGYRAFYGCGNLQSVIVKGNSLTSLADYVFAECVKLYSVYLPASLTAIGTGAFDNCDNVCIYCPYNSDVMIYAIENNIAYVASGANVPGESSVLDASGSNYTLNLDSMNLNGYAKLVLNYKIKEAYADALSDMKLQINFSQNYNLDLSTLCLDGEVCDAYTYENLVLTVPVTECSGKLEFYTVPGTAPKISSYAKLIYTEEELVSNTLIGSVNDATSKLELVTDSVATTPIIRFHGSGPKEEEVLIYINNDYVMTVTTDKLGAYSGEITIPEPVNGKGYVIKALAGTLTATQEVVYRTDIPQVETFYLYNNGNEEGYDLLGANVPLLVFDPQQPYVFEVKVTNREQIENINVYSVKNNQKYSLEAFYDEAKDAYVTSGYFVESDHNYMPGDLYVGINCKQEDVSVTTSYNFETVSISEKLAKTDVETDEEGTTKYYFMNLSRSLSENSAAGETYLDFEITTVTSETDDYESYHNLLASNGIVVPGENDTEYLLATDYSVRRARTYIYRDNTVQNGDIIVVTMKLRSDNATWETLELFAPEMALLATGTEVSDKVSLYEIQKSSRDRKINASADIADKEEALRISEELYKDSMNHAILEVSLPKLVSHANINSYVSVVYTGLASVIGQKTAYFRACGDAQFTGWNASVRWTDAPTGYVYEGVTSHRLNHAKVTVYYKETEDGEAVLWNASEYGLENPVYTDQQGVFLLDMPTGYWMAKIEAEGYEPQTTDWYATIPQKTGLMISMVSEKEFAVSEFAVMDTYASLVFSQYVSPNALDGAKLYDADGNEMSYTLEYDDSGVDASGNVFSKEFKFIYDGETLEYGAKISIKLPSGLVSSSGKAIENTNFTALCNVSAGLSVPENVSLKTGTISKIPVTVYHYDETLRIVASCEDETILSVDENVFVDTDGNGILTVNAKTSGQTRILVEIEGTQANGVIWVTVGDDSSVKDVQYQLIYSPGGAVGTKQMKYMVPGSVVILPSCTYSRTGYKFAGWNDGKKTYQPGASITMPEAHIVFTATWSKVIKPTPAPQVVKVSKIKLTGISKKIAAGKKITLTPEILPANAGNQALKWTSSNTKYATVNSKGVVTTKKAGAGKSVTITAVAADGSNVKATYKIKIMKHMVKKVKLKVSSKTVKAGKSIKIKTSITTNGKKVNKTMKWTSSNTKYATVNKKGVVKTKKAGKGKTVTITATSTDGTKKKAKIKLKIK